LGKDPEVRHFENGGSLARFPLATSETYTKKDTNEKVTQTEWHTVVTRGGLAAKVVEPYLKKGNSVYIEGRLRTRSWEDKDGITRYTTEVICDSLEMLGKKSDNVESTETEASTNSTPPIQESADDDLPF
jgi:single-strand DNA-binding protein